MCSRRAEPSAPPTSSPVKHPFDTLVDMSLVALEDVARSHGLAAQIQGLRKDAIVDVLIDHATEGYCTSYHTFNVSGCADDTLLAVDDVAAEPHDMIISILEGVLSSKVRKLKALRSILSAQDVDWCTDDTVRELCSKLKSRISELKSLCRRAEKRLKQNIVYEQRRLEEDTRIDANLDSIRHDWPQLVTSELKEKIVDLFKEQTSSQTLASFTCAVCAESCLASDKAVIPASDIDVDRLLKGHIPGTDNSDTFLNTEFVRRR